MTGARRVTTTRDAHTARMRKPSSGFDPRIRQKGYAVST